MEKIPKTHEEKIADIQAKKQKWEEENKLLDQKERPFYRFPDYFYAGFWIRIIAYLIDLLLIYSLSAILIKPLFILSGVSIYDKSPFSVFTLANLFIYLAYFILTTKLTDGQTIGKMIVGIRVICFKEEKLSWMTVLLREGVGRYILKTIPVLFLLAAFQRQKQHPIDMLCDTSVVTENCVQAYISK